MLYFATSPLFVFSFIWGVVIFLYSLGLFDYYRELHFSTYVLIFSTMLTLLFAWLLNIVRYNFRILAFPRLSYSSDVSLEIKQKLKYLFIFFIFGFAITIVYRGGLPLLSLFLGDGKVVYSKFGIPFFAGFVLSSFMIVSLGCWIIYLIEGSKKHLCFVLLLFVFPILIVNRGLLMVLIIELWCIYALLRPLNFKRVAFLMIIMFAALILFGLLGDLRVGSSDFVYQVVKDEYVETLKNVPSGFVWGYRYLTVSIHNLNYNIPILEPNYYPYHTLESLIPSPMRDFFYGVRGYEDKYVFKIESISNNTFSFYAKYLKDFGFVVTQVIFLFLFSIIYFVYFRLKKLNLWALFVYPVLYMALFLSIFHDYFTTLVMIFQCLVSYLLFKRLTMVNLDLMPFKTV